jgi:Asp-tRNA(Asn)/Glu-tRNA(Gln) amidotransferase A subunit family amidase
VHGIGRVHRDADADELLEFRLGSFRWTAPSSLTGSPQAVTPVPDAASGRSYGIGVLGTRNADSALLAALNSLHDEVTGSQVGW